MDYNGNIFGINDVNSLQVKNLSRSNYINWPEFTTLGYGYISGGILNPNNSYCSITRIDHATEVISSPGSDLPYEVSRHAGFNSSSYGYFCSGQRYPSVQISTVGRIDFITEVVSLPGKNTSNDRRVIDSASLFSRDYGYLLGGNSPQQFGGTNRSSYITRLDFTTETIKENNKFIYYELDGPVGVSAVDYGYGYISGGTRNTSPAITYHCAISRLDFSTEILSDRLSILTQGKYQVTTCESQFHGYFAGGQVNSPTYTSLINRLNFSNETISTLASTIVTPASSSKGTATESSYYGYLVDGSFNTITRLDFSNDTTSSLARRFPYTTSGRASVSSQLIKDPKIGFITGTYGYSLGGEASLPGPSTKETSEVTRMDFSTEITSLNRSNATNVISYASKQGASTPSYGYFGGGLSPSGGPTTLYHNTITRIDFSNQSVSENATNISSSSGFAYMLGLNNSTHAYFISGTSPSIPTSSSVYRMNFSDETISTRTNFPVSGNSLTQASSINGNPYGYILNPCTIYRYDFSSETASLPGKNLSTASRVNVPVTRSSTYAYFAGGLGVPATYFSTITRLEFATETVNDPGKFIPTAVANSVTFQNDTAGYISAGDTSNPVVISTVQKIQFSTETASTVPSPSITRKRYHSGVSDTTA